MSKEEALRTLTIRLSGLRFRRLAFSPPLERRFLSETNTFRSQRQWLEGVVGITLYSSYALTSAYVDSSRSRLDSVLRFGVVLPIALLVNASMFIRLPLWLRETGIVVASCIAGSIELFTREIHTPIEFGLAQIPIIAVLVFTNTVMRLRFAYSAVTFAWSLGAEAFLLLSQHQSTRNAQILSSVMTMATGVLTLTANYSQDREARLAFLRHTQEKDLAGSLARSNEDLAAAALTDSLTGLANRSALENYLTTVWSDPALARDTCSAIMVDIDHFKSLNDRYGHLYGDRVLKRVSKLIAEALRGEHDFIARFGGEEFVVILPHTPAHLGLIVAERLRGLVEMAGLPAVRNGDSSLQGMRATISCGVAAIMPFFYPNPYVLINAADEALYKAKREGRNLVRCFAEIDDLQAASSTIEKKVWH